MPPQRQASMVIREESWGVGVCLSSALLCSGMRVLRLEMFWLFRQKHLLGRKRQFIKLPRLDRTVPWGRPALILYSPKNLNCHAFFWVNSQSQARFLSSCKLINLHSDLHIRMGLREVFLRINYSMPNCTRKKINIIKIASVIKLQTGYRS